MLLFLVDKIQLSMHLQNLSWNLTRNKLFRLSAQQVKYSKELLDRTHAPKTLIPIPLETIHFLLIRKWHIAVANL